MFETYVYNRRYRLCPKTLHHRRDVKIASAPAALNDAYCSTETDESEQASGAFRRARFMLPSQALELLKQRQATVYCTPKRSLNDPLSETPTRVSKSSSTRARLAGLLRRNVQEPKLIESIIRFFFGADVEVGEDVIATSLEAFDTHSQASFSRPLPAQTLSAARLHFVGNHTLTSQSPRLP